MREKGAACRPVRLSAGLGDGMTALTCKPFG
jgi:hypothetical protein